MHRHATIILGGDFYERGFDCHFLLAIYRR
nr:MAG TPA: immunity protein [Caudoviricetes sp.]